MKKALYISIAALIALVSCSKESNEEVMVPKHETTLTLSLVQTKATINDLGSGKATFAWEEGDEIGVQVGDKLEKFVLDSFEGDKAKFKADITGTLEEGAYVAYPYVAEDCNNGVFGVSFPDTYEVSKANAFRLRWAGKLVKNEDGTFSTALQHTSAILRVTYASVPSAVSSVVMRVDEGSPVTVKFSQEKTENMNFYFPVKEGNYDNVSVVLATDAGEVDGTEQTLSKPGGKLVFNNGKIYRTPAINLNLYALITNAEEVEDGTYVIAYYDETMGKVKLFSFQNTMANAVEAADLVKDIHGLGALLSKGSQFYSTVVKDNYVAISGKKAAAAINVPLEAEELVAFEAAGNADAGKVSFTSPNGNIKVDKVIVAINDDYTATISAQFNAPDLVKVAKTLRGTDIPVTFQYLIDFAVEQAEKEGVTFTDAQIDRLESGFEHLCRLAKSVVKDKLNKDLMDITLQTHVLDVFSRYYDNVCDYSLQVSKEKKFGWATPIGFHTYDDGFTANISLPSYGWFTRLENSLKGTKEECVAYWAQFDDDYDILDFDNFFSRAANRALRELDASTYDMLHQMALEGKFTTIGNVYKKYEERFNDDLAPVYIYKKVE